MGIDHTGHLSDVCFFGTSSIQLGHSAGEEAFFLVVYYDAWVGVVPVRWSCKTLVSENIRLLTRFCATDLEHEDKLNALLNQKRPRIPLHPGNASR